MTDFLPATRPRLGYGELMAKLAPLGLDPKRDPVFVAGIRGYYRDTMGKPGANDLGIYDDALFLVADGFFGSYNANTDASRRKPGRGHAELEKGSPSLNPGLWRVHRFDRHSGKYLALCQRAGPVRVTRAGNTVAEDYPAEGVFGINIHSGGWKTTSSLGCQTIHPSQWNGFITSAVDQAKRHHGLKWNSVTILYALLDDA